MSKLLSAKLAALVFQNMSAEDLLALAKAKIDAAKGAKPAPMSKTPRGAASVIAAAPKTRTNMADKIVTLSRETREGKDVLVLKEPGFNYRFVWGFYYHNVAKPIQEGTRVKGTGWKWVPAEGVRLVPVEDFELLMTGLRDCYSGATLDMGDQRIAL